MKGHSHRGIITSIGQDERMPSHLSISVAHGKRKTPKKGEISNYDDRPRSNLLVHKRHASKYSVGMPVNVGMTPSSMEPDADEMGGTDDGDGDELGAAQSNLRKTVRGIAVGKRG